MDRTGKNISRVRTKLIKATMMTASGTNTVERGMGTAMVSNINSKTIKATMVRSNGNLSSTLESGCRWIRTMGLAKEAMVMAWMGLLVVAEDVGEVRLKITANLEEVDMTMIIDRRCLRSGVLLLDKCKVSLQAFSTHASNL
jgi:hypothetical protein